MKDAKQLFPLCRGSRPRKMVCVPSNVRPAAGPEIRRTLAPTDDPEFVLEHDITRLALQLQLFKWLIIGRLLHAFHDQFAVYRRI